MTVASTGNTFSYAGDGITKDFPFPRPFFEPANLRLIVVDGAGGETVQALGADYSVTGGLDAISAAWLTATAYAVDVAVKHEGAFYICTAAHSSGSATEPGAGGSWTTVWALIPEANGGEVSMTTAPATGETLIVTRRTDLKQNTTYHIGGRFSAEAHEDALDKLTLQAQDQQEQIGRAPKLKESTTSQAPTFPEPEAGKLVGWNSAGSDLVNTSPTAVGEGSITNAELAGMAQTTVKGRASGAGTGQPQDLTAAQLRAVINVEEGADVTDATNVAAVGAVMTTGAQTIDGEKTFSDDVTVQGAFTSTGIDDNATGERFSLSDLASVWGTGGGGWAHRHFAADQFVIYSGGNAGTNGANIIMYGGSAAGRVNDLDIRSGSVVRLSWDESAANWNYQGSDVVGVDRLELNDANFNLELNADIDPRITLDTNDYIEHDRSANILKVYIQGNRVWDWRSHLLVAEFPIRLASYTVATLPAGAAGETAFASDGRKAGEGVGAGTGVPVFHDGTNWLSDPYNNVTVVA